MPTLVQSAVDQRRYAVVSQFGSRVFSRPQEGASGFEFPGNQVVMVSDFNMPGLGPTPIAHEGRLAADFATPLRGQPELPSASFNVFLRPTQTEESRDDGLQSFVRMKKTGEPTEFRRLSPSDGQGELFYYKSAGWIIDVGESAATTSGGLMVPVTWQAIEERKTITPAVWSVSGYTIPATAGAFTIDAANINRVGEARPFINGVQPLEVTGLGLPMLVVSDADPAAAVTLEMGGTAFQDFTTPPSTTPIRVRLFADRIWEEWSADLFDQDLSAAFPITRDTNIDGMPRTAAQNGQAFANALREYWIANGQVPTFYLSIYGAPEL